MKYDEEAVISALKEVLKKGEELARDAERKLADVEWRRGLRHRYEELGREIYRLYTQGEIDNPGEKLNGLLLDIKKMEREVAERGGEE